MNKFNVLAFGAHPDDIEVLCAGTLAKYYKMGCKISIAISTNGGAGHPTMKPQEISEIRKKEAKESAEILDADLYWLDIEDQFLVDDVKTRKVFIDTIRKSDPDIVFCCNINDYHHDHRMVADLVFKTVITAHLPGVVTEVEPTRNIPILYYFDTLNGLNFIPDEYVDITDTIEIKKEMLSKHKSQISSMKELLKLDMWELVEINALYRGLQCNSKYAEGFKKADSYLMITSKRILP